MMKLRVKMDAQVEDQLCQLDPVKAPPYSAANGCNFKMELPIKTDALVED